MFLAAALFNLVVAAPIIVAPGWSFDLAFVPSAASSGKIALQLWRDFGWLVLLIGFGYYLVSRDVTKNHALVWLGILAKLFDVVSLGYRYATGVGEAAALAPGAIDGFFILLFALFLYQVRRTAGIPGQSG
jgi:hypothetical protein